MSAATVAAAPPPPLQELPLLVPSEMNPPMNPTLVVDGAGLDKVSAFLSKIVSTSVTADPAFGLDIETDIQENFLNQRIRTIQVGDRHEQYCIDLLAFAETPERMFSQQGGRSTAKCFEPVINTLKPYLDSSNSLKVGHNLQFEYEMLSWNLGLYTWNLWCTFTVEKLHWAGIQPFKRSGFWALDDLVARYMRKRISKELQASFDLKTPLTDEQVMYAVLDTRLPLGIYHTQRQRAVTERYYDVCVIENNYIPANGDMHVNGFLLDRDQWMKLVEEATTKHRVHVAEMDKHFLPIVGPKTQPAINLKELEEKWRSLSNRGEQEQKYHMLAQTKGMPAVEKARYRLLRDGLAAERLILKSEAGQAYKEASKYATWFKKEGAKMEGEAAIVYGSSTQLLKVLKKLPGLEDKKGKDGHIEETVPDTNDKTLSKLKGEFPVFGAIENYRSTAKLIESFGENILDFINPVTGRVHSRKDALGAETGRMSDAKPNLQQIPKDPRYRACFISRPGHKMGTLDFDGCEVRIMTEASGDPTWIEALNNNWDIHSVVAEKMQPELWMKATADACAFVAAHAKCDCHEHKHIRNNSKSINFGLAYGLTAKGLAEQLGITEARAEALLQLWHASNPVLSAALKSWGELATRTGEARDLAGRRRLFKMPTWDWCKELVTANNKKYKDGKPATQGQIKWKWKTILESIARKGCNHKIQGTNATATKLSTGCGFDAEGKPYFWHYSRPDKGKAFLVNVVHDEIIFESPDASMEESFPVAKDCMIRALQTYVKRVPVLVDGHIDVCWVK